MNEVEKRRRGAAAGMGAASALALCMAVAVPAGQASAVETVGVQLAQAGQSDFDIQSQPLPRALTVFGDQAGLQVTVDTAILAGRAAPAVSGRMGAEEALRRLLAGTGIVWRFTDPTTVVLEKAAADGAMTLDPVNVEGSATAQASPYEAARTEGTKSYTTTATTVGKAATAIKDIPQSVSVVTRQMMDDRGVTDLAEAMKQTTGMTVVKMDGAGLRNTIQSRGYAIDTVQQDGVSTTWDINLATSFDAAIYDRMEVLRGPAGLYQSGGEPGGTINLARKRALDHWSFGGEAGIGSWNAYRGVVDATGPLVESKRIRARVVGVLDDRESFINVVETEKQTFYGTVEADLTNATTLSLGAIDQKIDSVQSMGLPGYADGRLADVSRSTFEGADWNRMDWEAAEQFVELRHRLDSDGLIQLSGRRMERDTDNVGLWVNGYADPLTGDFNTSAWHMIRHSEAYSVDGHVSTPIRAGGLTHNLLLGADYRTEENESRMGSAVTPAQNLFSPDHNIPYPTFTYYAPSRTYVEQYGSYGQARIKPGVEWLTLVAGGRMSWWNTRNKNLVTGLESGRYSARGEFTPYGGVVFDASKEVSLYASYTEIFKPQSNQDLSGRMLDPRIGGAWEAGVKGSFFDDRLSTHLSVYRMVDENRAMLVDGCIGSWCYEPAGKVRSRGVEAQIGGSPWPNWDVSAGYAYVLTDHLTGTAANQGKTFSPSTPKHTANLWAKYTFPEGSPLYGFNLGGGVKTVTSFYGESDNLRYYQDGFTVFDAAAGYAFTENLEASLNVNNLLDEKYYEKAQGRDMNFYGAPRSAMLTLRAKF